MEFYKSFLKFVLFIAALPLLVVLIFSLAKIGLIMDFRSDHGIMWLVVLPVSFIGGCIYLYVVYRNKVKKQRYEILKQQAREEVINEMNLGR